MCAAISAVINTFNEEAHIGNALRSLIPWVDEAIVVDMKSSDRTAEIASSLGARVILTDGPGYEYAPRAFALEQASHEWTIVLDADEMVPAALASELRRLSDLNQWDAVSIPRCNYFFGAMLNHANIGPEDDRQLRFFKRPFVRCSSSVHADFSVVPGARLLLMPYAPKLALVHFSYLDTAQYIFKLNRYTTVEAIQAKAKGERATFVNLLLRPVYDFIWRYLKKSGFKDGWRGMHVSLLWAFSRAVANVKLRELERIGDRNAILKIYQAEINRILSEYSLGGRRFNR
jgi:glycosyltransferase involved in cell wall biosynthesis